MTRFIAMLMICLALAACSQPDDSANTLPSSNPNATSQAPTPQGSDSDGPVTTSPQDTTSSQPLPDGSLPPQTDTTAPYTPGTSDTTPGSSDTSQAPQPDSTPPQNPGELGRVMPSDLTYRGAFRLPDSFEWGSLGMDYYADGDNGNGSLFVLGPNQQPGQVAEVRIPAPLVTSNWDQLPVAPIATDFFDSGASVIASGVDATTTSASGLVVLPGTATQPPKLYGSVDWWYSVDGNTFPTIWVSNLDGSNQQGMYHVGGQSMPFHGNRMGDYLFTVPKWYADTYLGGRFIVTGKTRGAFNGSMGPSLFAFKPVSAGLKAGALDAIPMLWYPEKHSCAYPNAGDKSQCDYPQFTMCDKWRGGAFVEVGDRAAIMMLGLKGLGSNRYGEPQSNDCSQYKGYHCDPFERQIVFYDVLELADVAAGKRDPWSVVPYHIWRPTPFKKDASGRSCGEPGGVAIDWKNRRLFAMESGPEGGAVVIHVWNF